MCPVKNVVTGKGQRKQYTRNVVNQVCHLFHSFVFRVLLYFAIIQRYLVNFDVPRTHFKVFSIPHMRMSIGLLAASIICFGARQ